MHALVTGATGFLGRHLVRGLVARGHSVRAMVRDPARAAALLPAGVAAHAADLADPGGLDGAGEGADVVFHLGAAVSGPWEQHQRVTVEGTRRLLEACGAAGVRRFVHCSSLAVYDKAHARAGDVLTERSPVCEPLPDAGPYARGKVESERLVRELAPRLGMEWVIVRPGLVYGPEKLVFEHLGPRVDGHHLTIGGRGLLLPLTHVDSVTDALIRAAEAPAAAGRTFHIVDQDTPPAEYLRELARVDRELGARSVSVPVWPLAAACGTVEAVRRRAKLGWLPGVSAQKIRTRALGVRHDTTALREATGWRPAAGLREGLERSVAALRVREPAAVERVGLIGAGTIASFHIAALRRTPGVRIVGVLDANPAAAEAFAARHGIGAHYSDAERFYAEAAPQSVHIMTPPHTHRDVAIGALRRGAHVLIEKPMALDEAACREIVREAGERGLGAGVDHNYTAAPQVAWARRLVARGGIGEIVHTEVCWGFDLRRAGHAAGEPRAGDGHWMRHLPGGLLEDLLPHPLSVALELSTEELEPTHWHLMTTGRAGPGVQDELRLLLAGRRATASVALSLSAKPDDFIVTVHGTRGTLRLDLQNMLRVRSRLLKGPKAAARGVRVLADHVRPLVQTARNAAGMVLGRAEAPGTLTPLVRAHYASLASGRPLPADAAQGCRTVRIARRIWPA